MPTFGFTEAEVEAITVALTSFAENPLPAEARVRTIVPPIDVPIPAGPVGRIFELPMRAP